MRWGPFVDHNTLSDVVRWQLWRLLARVHGRLAMRMVLRNRPLGPALRLVRWAMDRVDPAASRFEAMP